MVHGIDLSGNNGTGLNFQKVHQDGQRFVFFKVNEGDWIDKTTTRARVDAARRHGLLVGGYDFVRPRKGRTGAQEFDIFWRRCQAIGLGRKGDLRPVIDIEVTALGPLGTRRYVRSWIKRCVKVTGKKPIIYTGQWFWDGPKMKGNKLTTQGCALWLAAYVPESQFRRFLPKGFDHISFWQYTDKGRVAGVPTQCDRNKYLATSAALKHGHTL